VRVTVVVTGADGYHVVFGWGDLDSRFRRRADPGRLRAPGQPMGDEPGIARLEAPGDKRGGRYVSTVKSIELKDPGSAQP